jgi:hypothetical protein
MTRVLRPGWNCDPLVKANRFALLVEGADYYAHVPHPVQGSELRAAVSRTSSAPGMATRTIGDSRALLAFDSVAVHAVAAATDVMSRD